CAAPRKFFCHSSCLRSTAVSRKAALTPSRALSSEAGSPRSPSTTSTPGRSSPDAFAAPRTRARTRCPAAESRLTTSRPFVPVAPVTRIIVEPSGLKCRNPSLGKKNLTPRPPSLGGKGEEEGPLFPPPPLRGGGRGEGLG